MKTTIILLLAALMTSAIAEEPPELRDKLLRAMPSLSIDTITQSPIDGMYAVALKDGTVIQATADGRHFVYGDLYEISSNTLVNHSEGSRNARRRTMLGALDEDDMVVFAPREGQVKATVTVFTDVDCGFCRKLHQEVPEMNRMGIAVRYLAFPRTGIHTPHTATYKKIVSAWCADNRQLAMTKAKAGQPIEEKTCENPVDAQFLLGEAMGVTGTPAIVYEDGRLQSGYLPAADMASRIGIN